MVHDYDKRKGCRSRSRNTSSLDRIPAGFEDLSFRFSHHHVVDLGPTRSRSYYVPCPTETSLVFPRNGCDAPIYGVGVRRERKGGQPQDRSAALLLF